MKIRILISKELVQDDAWVKPFLRYNTEAIIDIDGLAFRTDKTASTNLRTAKRAARKLQKHLEQSGITATIWGEV